MLHLIDNRNRHQVWFAVRRSGEEGNDRVLVYDYHEERWTLFKDLWPQVLEGIAAAQAAGLKVKLNTVALKGINRDEIPALMDWAHGRSIDLTLIEVMPLGEVETDRFDHYLPLSEVRADLERRYTLSDSAHRTGGPARTAGYRFGQPPQRNNLATRRAPGHSSRTGPASELPPGKPRLGRDSS